MIMMVKMYKYWIYYLNEEIYAYTDNKEYAKIFESNRNMKLFKKVKMEISKEGVNYLAKEFQEAVLVNMPIDIYDKETHTWIKSNIIVTNMEKITILNVSIQIMNEDLYKFCWFSPYPFNNKIIKALHILEYDKINSILTNSKLDQFSDDYYDDEINIKADMLGIFIHYYGRTLKGR